MGPMSLGEQAASLRDPQDRLKALRRVTSTAQILLAYSMVMRALSQTTSRYAGAEHLFCCNFFRSFIIVNDCLDVVLIGFFSPSPSASVCNQSSGLEALGLADIRTLVRLMCLAAAGRVHTSVDLQGLGVRGQASERSCPTFLSFLSSAIGSLVSHSPTAYRELVDICTQV